MTDKSTPENQGRPREGFETRSPGSGGPRKKAGRVSQRRELAIVTLGMAASIAGLGGLLAANPPSWAVSQADVRQAITTEAAVTPGQSASTQNNAIRPSSGTDDDSAGASAGARSDADRDEVETVQASAQQQASRQAARREARRAARQSLRQPAQQSTPVYSAPTQTSPSAVSQGS
ncbi:MAG TPA: hypothetical protein VFJ72_10495 [Rubrobacteraceae bacterium]|nr:hypothetical protein [Rubrobacteraceae bacterium]